MSDERSPDDPLPALRAGIDQMVTMAPELARAIRGYVDAFEAEGFTTSQALYLTMAQVQETPGEAP